MSLSALESTPVLVTGGAGFIGSHLVDALLGCGARVRVLDDFSTGHRRNLDHVWSKIEVIEADIRDLGACRRAADGVRVVYHQAALGSVPRSLEQPSRTIDINVGGTTNVFTAARDAKVERIVYASSSSVYGDSEALPKREGEEGKPLSPYALSKRINEELADVFGRCFEMQFIGLRYFNVYGPRQDPEGPYAAVIPRFFRACQRGEAPLVYGDGTQSRDFTFVADAVRANLLASVAPASACSRAYNIGASGSTSVNDLARLVCEVSGANVSPQHAPPRSGDIRHSRADVGRAKAAFGFEPTAELQHGLRTTYDAFGATS